MDRRSRHGPEPTTLEAVGNQWHHALVVLQAGEEEEDVNITSLAEVITSVCGHAFPGVEKAWLFLLSLPMSKASCGSSGYTRVAL